MSEQPPIVSPETTEQYYRINLSVEVVTTADNHHRAQSLAANFISRLYPLSIAGVEHSYEAVPVAVPPLQEADFADFMEYQKTRAAVEMYRDSLNLTGRETEVMDLLSQGLSHAEIADELNISAVTVRTHQDRAARKMGTSDRFAMTALYNGLAKNTIGPDSK